MRWFIITLSLGALACDAVPTLSFDGGAPEQDGATEAAPDATLDVADTGIADADAGTTEGGCPNELPDAATKCCGAIACYGVGCSLACAECQQICTPFESCCPNPQGKAFCKLGQGC